MWSADICVVQAICWLSRCKQSWFRTSQRQIKNSALRILQLSACCQPCLLLLLGLPSGQEHFLKYGGARNCSWLPAALCCRVPALPGGLQDELELCPASSPSLLCPGILLLHLLSPNPKLWLDLLCWCCLNLYSRLLGQYSWKASVYAVHLSSLGEADLFGKVMLSFVLSKGL